MKKVDKGHCRWLKSIFLSALLIMLVSSAAAGWKPDAQFGLGGAGEFAVFLLGKPIPDAEESAKLDLSSVTVYGDVAVGPYSEFDFQGPAKINGDLYLDPTLTRIISNVGTLNGVRYSKDLAPHVDDALSASVYWAAQPAGQKYQTLVDSLTIQGQRGLNVIAIRGIDFRKSTNSAPLQLLLKGPADDPASALFVLNIAQKLDMGGGAVIRGEDPGRVLINVLPGLTPVRLASGSYIGGTLLAVDRKMGPLSGTTGPLIGAQLREISLLGGAALNPPQPGQMPIAVILGPEAGILVGETVHLDGSASSGPDPQSTLTYHWSFAAKPDGSNAVFSDQSLVNPFFSADIAGDYLVQLVVGDGIRISDPVRLRITATQQGLEADLALRIIAEPSRVYLNSPLTLRLLVDNLGTGTAETIVLKATLLGRTDTVAFDNPACSFAAGEVECALGRLAQGERQEVQVYVSPTKPPNFDVLAVLAAPGVFDPDLSNNEAFLRVKVLKLNE